VLAGCSIASTARKKLVSLLYCQTSYDSIIISDMETHIISSPERCVQFYHSTLQYPESWNDHIVNKTQADITKSNNKYKYIIPYSAIRKWWKIWCTAKIGLHMINANRVQEKDFITDFVTFCPQIQIQESFPISEIPTPLLGLDCSCPDHRNFLKIFIILTSDTIHHNHHLHHHI